MRISKDKEGSRKKEDKSHQGKRNLHKKEGNFMKNISFG